MIAITLLLLPFNMAMDTEELKSIVEEASDTMNKIKIEDENEVKQSKLSEKSSDSSSKKNILYLIFI